MSEFSFPPRQQFVDNFTDLNSLDAVKKMGRAGDEQSLREVARQFEAMFVQQLLKTMRATEDVFADGNYTQSSEMKFHRDLLDQQMSLTLTQNKGLGLAEALFAQMRDQYGKYLPQEQQEIAAPATTIVKHDRAPASIGARIGAPLATQAVGSSRATPPLTKPDTGVNAPSVVAETELTELEPVEKMSAFVDTVYDLAQRAAQKLGVAVEGIVAQAALETGWGQHVLADGKGASSHNLFNIKADQRWQGATVSRRVLEYDQGTPVQMLSKFRRYSSLSEAFNDFTDFLKNSARYQSSLGASSVADYARALQAGGYATDPKYAEKIERIASSPVLKNILSQKMAQ